MGVVCSDLCIMGQVVDWHGGPLVFSGMVGRGYFLGIVWHGGMFFWVFSMLIGVSGGQIGIFFGRFWAFFWVFSKYHGFFWVFSGLIGIFSPPIRWPRFQIGGVGGGSGGRCWLQLVCVWLGVCGRR